MATSTNYGWAEPDNSSLVKNGASDIRTLGDAIDASVWNIGFGQAGKNKIINGNFGIWQRGTSFTNPTDTTFLADRFSYFANGTGKTVTVSQQTFTPGTAPVAGYEGKFFFRVAQTVAGTGATYHAIVTKMEDVQTFAGQTVTVSFWMKMSSATTLPSVVISQDFGSGGSTRVTAATLLASQAITTSWVRYSATATLPSIAGKTIGTGSALMLEFNIPINSVVTTDIWGVQLEAGSIATPFQTASGGSPQAELAMCQRYYFRNTGGETYSHYGIGMSISTTFGYALINLPVTMRVKPTAVDFGNVGITDDVNYQLAASALVINWGSPSTVQVSVQTAASQVQYRTCYLTNQNNTAGFIGFSAEL
jgi:hypothetical protein